MSLSSRAATPLSIPTDSAERFQLLHILTRVRLFRYIPSSCRVPQRVAGKLFSHCCLPGPGLIGKLPPPEHPVPRALLFFLPLCCGSIKCCVPGTVLNVKQEPGLASSLCLESAGVPCPPLSSLCLPQSTFHLYLCSCFMVVLLHLVQADHR